VFLKVKGIGKIQDSTIELKGITVIAGENNTGKSTFGKVLYCMFNAFHNADEMIHDARVNDIRRIFWGGLPRFRDHIIGQNAIDDILSDIDIRKTINEIIKSYSSVNPKLDDSVVDTLLENLKRSISIDKHEIHKTIITRCFKEEFLGKINHINRSDTQGDISLEIKNKNIEVTIKSNECTFFADDVGLLHDAIYIDTPLVMDDIKNSYGDKFGFYNMISHRDDLLGRLINRKSNSTILEEVIFKQKINNMLSNIHSIVGGEFKEDDDNLLFAEQGLKKPVPLSSVSTGIKMFLIIKRLLELGEIRERDILVFDEPEIHLHPEWQIRFAEILILLQKEFNLTILLTTHSPYFLHAIQVYTGKYEIEDRANFYIAESEGDTSKVRDVTECVDTIYKQLARPFQELENERYRD
jgi:AAA15 family ATPase/GTPase